MKLLTATPRMQGGRATDFNWCIEGELVWIQEPCDDNRRRSGSPCGCGRAFAGLASHRATTTAMVRELPGFTPDHYVSALRTSFTDGGWPGEWAAEIGEELMDFADSWPAGAVIERDLDVFKERLWVR